MKNEEAIRGISNAASYLEISEMTVLRLLRQNEFPKPAEEQGTQKLIRSWAKEDLDEFKKTLRKPGERKADQKVTELTEKVRQLEKANLESNKLPREAGKLLPIILDQLAPKELLELTSSLAKHLGMKLIPEKTAKTASSEPEKEDWKTIRELLTKEAKKHGGNRPLAKLVGVSESIIRRFVKGETKTLIVTGKQIGRAHV